MTGDAVLLPQGAGLSAHRILQEALSNVMKHAPGPTVAVEIGYLRRVLCLHVLNGPGSGPRPVAETGGGHGRRDAGACDQTADDGHPSILVLTTFDLDDYVYEAPRAGASGFLLKDASARELSDAVRVVAGGEALLAPTVTRRLIAEFARMGAPRGPDARRLGGLTNRETEVLGLVARGMSNAEIAAKLVVAEQTVKTHVGRVLMKLRLRDRTQVVVFAYETGLVRPGE